MTTDPDTLDPGRADDSQKNQIVLESQETLLRLIDGKLTEAGAESYEVSEDGNGIYFPFERQQIFRWRTCKSTGLCKLYPQNL